MEPTSTARDAAVTSLVNASLHSARMAHERISPEAGDQVLQGCLYALREIGVTLDEVTRARDWIIAETTWLATTGADQVTFLEISGE